MAYYSGSGQIIRQGAAGLGEYFGSKVPPAAAAFHSGSLGEYFQGAPSSAPSFHDGSLGLGASVENGVPYGPSASYKDGSLGAMYEQAAAGVGYPLFVDGQRVDRPMTIHHGPTAVSGCMACSGIPTGPNAAYRDGVLGAVTAAVNSHTLDLTNPDAIKELKGAMADFAPEVAMVQTPDSDPTVGTSYFDSGWYTNGIWDVKADKLWWVCQTKLLALAGSPYKKPSDITKTRGTHNWPNATGVGAVVASGVGSPGSGVDFQGQFPILYAFTQSMVAAGGASGFKVAEPFFNVTEQTKGKGFTFAGLGLGSLLGLGALAAGAAYLVMKK